MFSIENGRINFFQWDLNQRLVINSDSITEVHYSNRTSECSLITEVYEENGVKYSNIPNILLQTDCRIHIYAVDADHTVYEKTYKVHSRSKPADYVYTETEIKSWENLENYVRSEIENMKVLISTIPKFDILVVEELPVENIQKYTIYLVKADEEEENLYTEYLYINGDWELLGNAKVEVDLTGYIKNTDIATGDAPGVVLVNPTYGLFMNGNSLRMNVAQTTDIDKKQSRPYMPITCKNYEYAVKVALTNNSYTLTDAEKIAAKNWLGITDSGNSGGIKYYSNPLSISPISEGGTNPMIYLTSGQTIPVNEGDIARFNSKLWLFQGVSNGGWTQLN